MQEKQIFQSATPTRWQRIKWSTRVLLLLLLLALGVVALTMIRTAFEPPIPRLKARAAAYKAVLDSNQQIVYRNSELARRYKGFRRFISEKEPRLAGYPERPAIAPLATDGFPFPFPAGIRAAFYVAWDPQSFYSLQRNIRQLNLVFPEWMFIDPSADTLYTKVDLRALAVMQKAGVAVMPMLSNFHGDDFNGATIHRILHDRAKRERLINDVLKILRDNHFAGVNVDLEELQESNDEPFIAFQKALYERLHAEGFLVTQDVVPFNEDYRYEELAKYNDYIVVMAYDQFSANTRPGPIAEQRWIEGAVDEAAKNIPSGKLILALCNYGYDWPKGAEAATLTYQQVLNTAREAGAAIRYNNDTYNLSYGYVDDEGREHTVYFADAATSFNSLRFATEYGLAGTALWRLGSEDSRLWDFYRHSMTRDALRAFDFKGFSRVRSTDDVDYIGEGEVLDVKAEPTDGKIVPEVDSTELLIAEENYVQLPSMFVVQKYGRNDPKKLVLTFDDGPDPTWTPKILDILSEKKVPGTFFIVGLNAENNIPLIKRIYREGHELGNHTFTHPNIANVSRRRAEIEMEATRSLLECITGHSTILFRAPFNADFEPEKMEELIPVAIARQKNYLDIGESIDPLDWEVGVTADTILRRVLSRKDELNAAGLGGNIILLHDAGGESRAATVKALPRIIDSLRARGYSFTTVADLLSRKKEDLMPSVPRGSGYYLLQVLYVLAEGGYWAGHILFTLFVVFILLSIARLLLLAWLALRQHRKEQALALLPPPDPASLPLVSIIVPAYNEELNAVGALRNLLKAEYPRFNVVFVDDGSTDSTYQKVSDAFRDHPLVQVLTKPNGGKASALNWGIRHTDAPYVVCIDADTRLHPGALSALLRHFLFPGGETVGAVAGNVKVGNEVNLLTRWQAIEYISSQNFDRRAFAQVNAITVVPGAVGAFRKAAIEAAGGFTTDTLAEDCDLTIRILRQGYAVRNENGALAFTEAPENTRQFIKQRFRWSFGILQTFWKHKDLLFNTRYRWLGCLAMPNILLFQYIIPAFIPLADFFMVLGLVTGNASKIVPYYFVFMLVDAAVALLAFSMEGERLSRLVWLIPQRLIYRWLMWWVLFKAVRRAAKGELQSWGVLKRTGRVQEA